MVYYTVRDMKGLDHLATEGKRTLCGLAWLNRDTLFGYAVGHLSHPAQSSPWERDCKNCMVHLVRLASAVRPHPHGPGCDCDEVDEEGAF